MSRDEEGYTIDPLIVSARLRALARWSGHTHEDATLGFGLAAAHRRVGELEEARLWRHAYLGRYMGVTPDALEAMSTRLLRAYVAAVGSIVKQENGPPTPPEKYL